MKKVIILLLISFFSHFLFAQNQDKPRISFGISGGIAIPLKNGNNNIFKRKMGVNINFIEFDYIPQGSFGLTLSGFYAHNKLTNTKERKFSCGGLLIGPLISHTIIKDLYIDIAPLVGFGVLTSYATKYPYASLPYTEQPALNFGLKLKFKYRVSNLIAVTFSPEYLGIVDLKNSGTFFDFDDWTQNFNLRLGLSFILK